MLVSQTAIKQDEWFLKPKPKRNAKYRLFCFPYAGGNISTYYHQARSGQARSGQALNYFNRYTDEEALIALL